MELKQFIQPINLPMKGKSAKSPKNINLLLSGGSDYHGANKPNIQLGTGLGHLFVPYEIKDALLRKKP